jgi:hypothetical protein
MKKYLREIELAGIVLMIIGIVMYRILGILSGYIVCAIGIGLWLTEVIYKALHWNEYQKENKQNNIQMIVIILLLIGSLFLLKCH